MVKPWGLRRGGEAWRHDMRPCIKTMGLILATAGLATGCAARKEMKTDRSQLIAGLEHEMNANTKWLRIHAAEALLDNGESGKIAELFRTEAETASPPYRIGVWRVLARSTTGEERNRYVERIREAMRDT